MEGYRLSTYTGKYYDKRFEQYRLCVVQRESGGNYDEGSGGFVGAYQFSYSLAAGALLATRHLIDAKVHGLTLARAMAEAKGNNSPGNAASVLKNSATHVAQTRAELTLEIMGHQGLGWEGDAFNADELTAVRSWLGNEPLWRRAMSVRGALSGLPNTLSSIRLP